MVTLRRKMGPVNERNLKRVIEPLASYICATEQPKAVLLSALAALVNEVEQTTRTARAHVTALSGDS